MYFYKELIEHNKHEYFQVLYNNMQGFKKQQKLYAKIMFYCKRYEIDRTHNEIFQLNILEIIEIKQIKNTLYFLISRYM